jgi:hypothetical protein
MFRGFPSQHRACGDLHGLPDQPVNGGRDGITEGPQAVPIGKQSKGRPRMHLVAPDLRGYNLSQRPHRETWGLASAGPDADQPPCPHAGKEPFPRNA